jgi:hypothetical protein
MKVQGREQGSGPKAVALMRDASAKGHETVADIYPYLAGQTGLGALFVPAWAVAGGRDEMLKRFRDPELRARIIREIEEAITARILTAENIDMPSKKRRFSDYMLEMNAGAGETMIRILETEHPSAILKFGAEEDLITMLQYPGSAVSCDCGAMPPTAGMHPRAFGTFPRVLGHYVRETKALTLEDAVRKMTGLPASIVGISDRGFLAVGMAADIAVFDPATIIDHATYEQPLLPSEGVRHLLVNGRVALRDGQATGEKAGLTLARLENMPSRPMRMEGSRSLTVKAGSTSVDFKQAAGVKARGAFRFVDPTTKEEVHLTETGLLQTAGKWASFTGLARTKSGTEDQAVTVIVDGANPMNSKPGLFVQMEGGRRFEAVLADREYKIGAP